MRRLAVSLAVAAALAAGCGSAQEDDAVPEDAVPAATTTGPTRAQLAARKKLIAQLKAGDIKCYCTSALRARERVAKGLADAP